MNPPGQLDYETAALRARQEISKAEREAGDIRTDRQTQLAAELRQVRAELDQATARMETARGLVHEANITAPMAVYEKIAQNGQAVAFRIMRRIGADTEEGAATEATPLRPGDTLRVSRASPPENIAGGGGGGRGERLSSAGR